MKLQKLGYWLLLVLCMAGIIATYYLHVRLNKMNRKNPVTTGQDEALPLYYGKPFALPDSLHYIYNSFAAEGIALSGGRFKINLRYPVFRSSNPQIGRLRNWMHDQVYILEGNSEHSSSTLRQRFQGNYSAYANHILNSWLAFEHTTFTGCMQESLAIDLALNRQVYTFRIHHKGYWGGARGDDITSYAMFDRNFQPLDVRRLISGSELEDFNDLLDSYFVSQIADHPNTLTIYDREFRINPYSMGLVPNGLAVVYSGYTTSFGYPQMLIPAAEIKALLQPRYRDLFSPPPVFEASPSVF